MIYVKLAGSLSALIQGALTFLCRRSFGSFLEACRDGAHREPVSRTALRGALLLHDAPWDFLPKGTEQQWRRW